MFTNNLIIAGKRQVSIFTALVVLFPAIFFAADISWVGKASMPTSRSDFGTAAVNGKIYAIGGYDASGAALSTVEEFDPQTNAWTAKANMPTAREMVSACVVNNKIYAIGGDNGFTFLTTVEEYDPQTNTWTAKADMPTAREELGVCVVDNKIYAIGGYDGTGCVKTVEEYDPQTNSWTAKADMPTARESFAIETVNGKIYAIGGDNVSADLKNTEEFNPAANTWTVKANMPTARYGAASSAVNGKIYVVGGALGGNELAVLEEYDPALNTWTRKADMPTPRYYLSAAALDGKFYAVGGFHIDDMASAIEEYDPSAGRWTVKNGTLSKRSSVAALVIDSRFYLFGGYDEGTRAAVEEGSFCDKLPVVNGLYPVNDLSAAPVSGARVKLTWSKSNSKNVASYNIYYAESPDAINYSYPMDTLDYPAESWVSYSDELESGKAYYFVVRSVNGSGEEEKNTSVVSATMVNDITKTAKALVKSPQNGKKVSGNRVMVMAESISTKAAKIKAVLFQYKRAEDALWSDITPADANHLNPASKSPYFIHWNVDSVDEGKYNIRAVATGSNGSEDAAPGYVTIEINHGDPDMLQVRNDNGEQENTEKIDNIRANTIRTGGDTKSGITMVKLAKGSIDQDSSKLTLVVDPVERIAPPEGVKSTGEYRKIELAGATLSGKATISIPYTDNDYDDKDDNSGIPLDTLCVFAFNEKTSAWEKLPSTIDYTNRVINGVTTHFSMFALFGAPADNFNAVRAYPNPFIPSKGHTFVKLDNLTLDTKVRIFTINGDMVYEKEGINTGEFTWNAVNQAGSEVASGIYICLLTNGEGVKKTVKVAVIR
jgi:N-acetylneuraminic acid mutarotase